MTSSFQNWIEVNSYTKNDLFCDAGLVLDFFDFVYEDNVSCRYSLLTELFILG